VTRFARWVVLAASLALSAHDTRAAPPAPGSGKPPGSSRESPRLLVPAHADTVSIESEPAPLIVPGQSRIPESLVRTPQKFAREQLALGEEMERSGNVSVAVIAYSNAVHADSTLAAANARLGRLWVRLGRPAEAEPLLRRAVRLDPHNTDSTRELGLALSALGRHAEAISRLRRLTTLESARDDDWYALGVAYANAGRPRDAELPLRRAIALPPDRALEHRDLGVVLGTLNRPREARQEYRRALELDPGDASVWLNLGNLESRAGHPDSALAAYREAERRDSTYALAYEAEIKVLVQLDQRDAIADLYLRWVTAKPDDDDLRLRAVRHLAALDRRDRALEIGRDGVRFDSRSPAKHMILGLSLAAYGSTREALAELRQAEALYRKPQERERVRQLIASMSQAAPDSLREMFRADSVNHARPR
jgi:tetratricopeptide (TPR) repeat protein